MVLVTHTQVSDWWRDLEPWPPDTCGLEAEIVPGDSSATAAPEVVVHASIGINYLPKGGVHGNLGDDGRRSRGS